MKNVKLFTIGVVIFSCFYISFVTKQHKIEKEKIDFEKKLTLEIKKRLKVVEDSVIHDVKFQHTSLHDRHDTLFVYIDDSTISKFGIKHSNVRLLGKAIAESIKADTNRITVVINSNK